MKLCKIVIPIYKNQPNKNECISLERVISVLKDFPIEIIHPKGLDISRYEEFSDDLTFNDFDADFFAGIKNYNRLMTSLEFYQHYNDYRFILVYQLDAYVFKNNLKQWCELDYSYIGAPWVNLPLNRFNNILSIIPILHRYKAFNFLRVLRSEEWGVGNGGFSLRKTSDFIQTLTALSNLQSERYTDLNEDNFWSFVAPKINRQFSIPKWRTALDFAFENAPSACYALNNYQLPFGCHAWEKFEYDIFWNQFIK